MTVAPDALSFTVARISGHYAAKWDPAARLWAGQWTQGGRSTALNLAAGVFAPAPTAVGLDGDWDGALDLGLKMKLRLAFHIETGPHGTTGVLDSIDQQAKAALSSVTRDGTRVRIETKPIQGVFTGVLDASGKTMTGQWSQPSLNTPLVLTRRPAGQAKAVLNRPQTPVKPYPYLEEQVAYDDAPAHARLAGTLTLPKGPGPFPAVVLVAGSGANTRNEPILGHQIFLVLADHLTRNGIAVLRYDKRGTGASTGDYGKATTMDFADDVQAGIAYLKTRKDIDARHIGLIGHSEGGLIVPIVAVRDPSLAFIVMMAGPGVNGADVWREQLRLLLKAAGLPDAKIAAAVAQREKMIAILRAEPDLDKAAPQLRALLGASVTTRTKADTLIAEINTAWFREFFDYEPAPTLRKLRLPVLALIGDKDLQVPAAQNLPAIRAALKDDPDAEIDELPGLQPPVPNRDHRRHQRIRPDRRRPSPRRRWTGSRGGS